MAVGELWILEADKITGPWNTKASGGIENRFAVIRKPAVNLTYNLFAHPHFQNDGRILVSFNVNTSNFASIYPDTRNYIGRFYWLDVEGAVVASVPDTIKLLALASGIGRKATTMGKVSYTATRSITIRCQYQIASVLSNTGTEGGYNLSRVLNGHRDRLQPPPCCNMNISLKVGVLLKQRKYV